MWFIIYSDYVLSNADSHFFYPDPTRKKTIIGIVVNGGISRSHKNAIHVQNSKSIDIKKNLHSQSQCVTC